jgi:hypothetical protein
MGVTNFRTAQQFDPETDDGQYSGGLLGGLQAMMQQSQGDEYFQPGADSGPTPNGANSDGIPQGGLLGRLAALQAEQSRYQPAPGSNEQTPSASRDPNFRQLARVYITGRTQEEIDSLNRPDGQSSPRYSLNTDKTYSTSDGQPILSDVSPDPVRPGSQYAQGPVLCAAGPVGCAIGGEITVGQAILGGAAALLGGATILNQNKLPIPGNKPANAPTSKGSSEINVVPRTDRPGDGGALVKGDDSRNPCLDR